jgi:ribosomal protein S12 methylthiotransferase accessory factor
MTAPADLVPGVSADVAKVYRHGTHRVVAPAETVDALRPLLPVFGITRVGVVTGLDGIGIPVVMVCRPNARSLAVSQGKGADLDAARASGLMESIELYHAERIARPLKFAAWDELRFTHPVVDPGRLPRIADTGFHPALRLLWIEGFDLLGRSPLWLPYEMVHMDYTLPLPPASGNFVMSSNGLASGNHLLEAVVQGITEVIERDALSLWQAAPPAGRARRGLRLSSVDDGGCRELLDRYERAGVTVVVWDVTSDVGVAALRCTIVDREPNPWRPVYPSSGFGCHPSRTVALARALTEAAQSRLTLIASSRDDVTRARYAEQRNADRIGRTRDELAALVPTVEFAEVPHHDGATLGDDLGWLLGRLRGAGVEQVVMVDLTREEFEIPVVRIVIPGLESFYELTGYAPGPRARAARSAAARP